MLPGASGPVVSAALREVGILGEKAIPGEELLFNVFDKIGETLPSMMLARTGVRFSAGWDAGLVAKAGQLAAAALVEHIQPFAHRLVEEHRAAGRQVVMATTSPSTVCEPLGKLLGFDGVISTKYGVTDGALNGTVDGQYVWGRGKLAAVRSFAEAHDIDLDQSYAYSDSFFDQPLLGAVGYPVAVNPDPRLRVVAAARRWKVVHLDVPPGVPKLAGMEPQQLIHAFSKPELIRYAKFSLHGLDNLPATGPVILAANHRSYFDPIAISCALAARGRTARFLAKRELFDAPVVGAAMQALGGIQVDRGTGSDDPLAAAAEALDAGELVVILPEGTIPRGPAFFDPELKGRRGVADLARMTKAPVIPLGLWGTERVWPRSARVPAIWNVIDAPKVKVRIGEPVALKNTKNSASKDVERVMEAIAAELPAKARKTRKYSQKELASTYPGGVIPDSDEAAAE